MNLRRDSNAYLASLKQVERCLYRIEQPDIQTLMLQGYKVVAIYGYAQAITLAPHSSFPNSWAPGTIIIGTPVGIDLAYTLRTSYETLEAARALAAALIKTLRHRKAALVKTIRLYWGSAREVLMTNRAINTSAANQRYQALADSIKEKKAKKTRQEYTSHQEDAILRSLRKSPKKGGILLVKATLKQAKKLATTVKKHGWSFAYVDQTNAADEKPVLSTKLEGTDIQAIEALLLRIQTRNQTNFRLVVNEDDTLVLFSRTLKTARELVSTYVPRAHFSSTASGVELSC